MSGSEQLELAERIARRAHAGQVDKSGVDYVEHCRRVAGKLTDEHARIVAWLHDVLEDTDACEDDLRLQFDDGIVDAVVALTRREDEATEDYYARVRGNDLARQVKLADIHDNLDPLRLSALDSGTAGRLVIKYSKALSAIFEERSDDTPSEA